MTETEKTCSVEGCSFPSGKCRFLSETEQKASEFQVAEINGLPDINDAAKRWGIIIHASYDRLNDSNCSNKEEISREMEKITPDILKKVPSSKA